jgi:hypothetical protein
LNFILGEDIIKLLFTPKGEIMKSFWKRYSYSIVKLFVNQFAISIFGLVLALACGKAENNTLMYVTSIGAIIFYLFLLYAAIWEIGAKDKISVDGGRLPRNYLNGLYMGLMANIPNFILAILVSIGLLFADGSVISKIGGISSSISIFIQGMYSGILAMDVGGAPLNSYFFVYFLIPLPAVLICALSYFFGIKNYHFTNILISETPEEAEMRREKKKRDR